MSSHGETSEDEVITKALTATDRHNANRFTHHI